MLAYFFTEVLLMKAPAQNTLPPEPGPAARRRRHSIIGPFWTQVWPWP
jgi:hypothetical protein